ncbi:unnamed protein product, partial [Caretta caretta]
MLPEGRPGRDDDPAAQSARGGAGPEPAGEFVLLLGRSGSTACPMDAETCPASASTAPRDGQETLVLLLKSFPLGCYFNIYGFGSEFESFYPQSVENTQQTKAESLQRLQLLQTNLGGTEFLEPLRAIYRSPCRDGHPRQAPAPRPPPPATPLDTAQPLAPPRDSPTPQAESPAPPNPELQASGHSDAPQFLRFKPSVRVYGRGGREHLGHHRRGAASPGNPQVLLLRHRGWGLHGSGQRLCPGSGGQRRVHHRPEPRSAQGASVSEVGPAAVGDRDLTELGSAPGIQAELLHWDPEVIFAGQRCLVYAQLRRQPQHSPRHSHGGHHPAVPHPGPDLEGDAAVLPAATGWRQAVRSPAGRQVAAAGAGGGRGHGVGGGQAPGTGGQPELGGRLLPHGLRGGGRGAGAAGEVRCPAGRAGTGGVSLAEAGVSAKCRRLVEPGPLAGCCAGGERDRRRGRIPSE